MNTKRLAALPTVLTMAVVASPNAAFATDRTILDGQTETATQVLSDAGDTLKVSAFGSVLTSGHGVEMTSLRQKLANFGTIATAGTAAYGIYASAPDAMVVNSGTIATYDICSYGVFATADNFSIVNNGSIVTRGDASSYGIYVEYGDHARIINNGLIDTSGETGNGITLWGAGAEIANHGTIRASGANSTGIYVWHDSKVESQNVLVNTGTIRVTGTRTDGMYGQGIYANASGMTVRNSGSVSSPYEAFYMGQRDQTLAVLAGSRIEGGILFAHADTAVLEFGRGLDARLTLTLPGEGDINDLTIRPDGQGYAIDGNVITVVSPETLRAGAVASSMASNAVASAVGSRLGGTRQNIITPAVAQLAFVPTLAAPGASSFAAGDKWTGWSTGFGSASTSGDIGMRTGQSGMLFGFDKNLSEDRMAGVFGGLGYGVVELDGGSRVETTTLVGGGYGSFRFGTAFVDITATMGATFNDSARSIANNMVAGGIETAHGAYNGFFVSPSVSVGLDHDFADARVTPILSLRYTGIHQNGFGESGSAANVKFGPQTTHVFTARGEVEIGTTRHEAAARGLSSSFTVGAEGTFIDGSAPSASLAGTALKLAGSTSSEARGFVGMDFKLKRGGYDISAKGEIGYDTAGVLSSGLQVGIGLRF